ncbi:hypothetical protein Q5O89_26590 [Peribacillus frigoritolerans]|nr:hypothetical protein [Peribacillus frigoritolerans]
MKGLEKVNIPIGYLPHDIDASVDIRREYLHQNKISLIFPLYKSSFLRLYPEFADKLRWLPHHVNTEIFKDYNLVKDMDALLIGRVKQSYYSLRKKYYKKWTVILASSTLFIHLTKIHPKFHG